MNEWKSLLISIGGHAAILILSVIVGLFAHVRSFKEDPIKVDLIPGPIGNGNEGGGKDSRTTKTIEKPPEPKKKQPPKETKKDTKEMIKPKEIVKPTYNPNADIARLEKLLNDNKLKPETEVKKSAEIPTYSGAGTGIGKGGVYGGSSTYDRIIQQIVRNNWMQPGRASLGPNPPVVLLVISVDRHGNILSSKITQSSGIAQLDESALKAIEDSNPLPELPSYIAGMQKSFELKFIVD